MLDEKYFQTKIAAIDKKLSQCTLVKGNLMSNLERVNQDILRTEGAKQILLETLNELLSSQKNSPENEDEKESSERNEAPHEES